MSDMLEKIYREEQNTDEKFVAAAKFFMGLKEKTAVKAPPETKKVRVDNVSKKIQSVKAVSRQNTKNLVQKGGGSNIRLNATNNLSQGSAPQARTFKKTQIATTKAPASSPKKLPAVQKKKVKVVIASALTEHLVKEAYLLQSLRMVGQGAKAAKGSVQGTVKSGVTKARDAAQSFKEAKEPFMQGVKSDGRTVAGELIRKPFGGMSMSPIGRFADKITRAPRRLGRNIADLGRNAQAVRLRKAGTNELKVWDKANPRPGSNSTRGVTVKPTPEEMAKWTAAREAAKAKAFAPLKNFNRGRSTENALGINATTGSVFKAIRGPDGKITGKSVFKGAEDLGLFDPSTLATLGMSGVASVKAAKTARQAAIADRNKKLMIGGGLGLGALALMKSNKGSKPPQNYS